MKLGKILTFKDIIEDESLPPEAIIENGVLLDQSLLTIIAPAKSKKTFLCMNFAKAIASGNGFAGFDVNWIDSNNYQTEYWDKKLYF